jgi:hypothetical protein
MSMLGLTKRFKLNRPLTEQEIICHLPQKERTRCLPFYCGNVIKMNSTYLECVDNFFAMKGMVTGLMLPLAVFFIFNILRFVISDIQRWDTFHPSEKDSLVWLITLGCCMALIFLSLAFYGFSKELFRLTHYPIRFNRKTRKVHFFRTRDCKPVTADWDNLYFTVYRPENQMFDKLEVIAHVMAGDGKTVLDTFALPFEHEDDYANENPLILIQFEFIRRYMEEPDELPALAEQVTDVVNVADRRETWLAGYSHMTRGYEFFLMLIIGFMALFTATGRWIANHTSKIPKWPAEIEAECQIEPDDPYIRDWNHLGDISQADQAE